MLLMFYYFFGRISCSTPTSCRKSYRIRLNLLEIQQSELEILSYIPTARDVLDGKKPSNPHKKCLITENMLLAEVDVRACV